MNHKSNEWIWFPITLRYLPAISTSLPSLKFSPANPKFTKFAFSLSLSLPAMATFTHMLAKPPSSLPFIPKINPLTNSSTHLSNFFTYQYKKPPQYSKIEPTRVPFKVNAAAASGTSSSSSTKKASTITSSDEKVQQVHSIEQFDEALRSAKNKLVVVEYAASHSYHSRKIYPFMVELSRTCSDVVFLLVMGDESEETKELCRREKIEQVPHFSFYKSMEKIHEEEGIGPDELVGDVLYYGDNHSGVVQLHSRDDVEKLIEDQRGDNKLIVLDVGLKHCGPCVKVYPTVVKLSKQMAETVAFARMNGDENDSCMQFLRDMNVIEVPTFLFIRDGEIRGRYVGSGKGELIGEILRYQGVRVTY